MKIILFIGMFCFFVNNLFAGDILSTQEIKSVIQKNILLKREELKIEKAEKVSNNVVLLNVILNSKKIQFLLIDVDGKSYMFAVETMLSEKILKELVPQIKNVEKISTNLQMLKVLNDKELINVFIVNVDNNSYAFINGIDEKGNAISSPKVEKSSVHNDSIDFSQIDTKVIENGILWSFGVGKETLYVVLNPSDPWSEKFEAGIAKSKDFLSKYTVKVMLMPFLSDAKEKAIWVLSGNDEKEKAKRYKKLMVDKDTSWKDFKPTVEEKAKIDDLLEKSLVAAKALKAVGTPTVFDSKFQEIKKWDSLLN